MGKTKIPKKVMLAFGTRPEAIKMAPLVHALAKKPRMFDVQVCVSAQHREMLDQALKVFDIVPDIDLDLMKQGQDLYDVTSSVLLRMRDVFRLHRPDILLVHGDTTTTFSAAVAAFYQGIPVGHVEAGLRTFDLQAPFPEEFNRQVTSRIAAWHFAPTAQSRQNLVAERVPESRIVVTGNTVIDALFWVINRIESDDERRGRLSSFLDRQLGFNWKSERFVLITGHRRENFGDGFLQICEALKSVSEIYPDVQFVYPVHLNPQVQAPVMSILGDLPNVCLTGPLDYEPFVYLLKHCYFVLTDSGGIQEEAPSLGKPVLVMRSVTERPEAVEAGTVRLVGADRERIVSAVSELLDDDAVYNGMARAHNPYGDGDACQKILEILERI